jgi:hypothetical protein
MSSMVIFERNCVQVVWHKNAPYTVEGYLMKTRSFPQDSAGRIAAIAFAKNRSTDLRLARRIALRWVDKLGLGFHPDTRAKDYTPLMPYEDREDYDRDMDMLAGVAVDQYEASLWAMRKRNLIGEESKP